jgi:hypothetical protein
MAIASRLFEHAAGGEIFDDGCERPDTNLPEPGDDLPLENLSPWVPQP